MPYDAMTAATISLAGHDDDLVEAYVVRPEAPAPRGGVIVIHHMHGLDRHSTEIVRRVAAMGYDAIAVNLYSRFAPGESVEVSAAAARTAGGLPDNVFVGDTAAAARWLRELPTSNGRVGIIGFCSGGRQAVLASMEVDLQAAVNAYGAFVTVASPPGFPTKVSALTERIGEVNAPMLGLFGADDQYPTPDEVAVLSSLLTKGGTEFEFHSYPDTGHAFFAVDRPTYRVEAATVGWGATETFFGKYLSN